MHSTVNGGMVLHSNVCSYFLQSRYYILDCFVVAPANIYQYLLCVNLRINRSIYYFSSWLNFFCGGGGGGGGGCAW